MVLFENEQAIALEKPAGLSMATRPSDPGAAARVIRTLLDASGDSRDGGDLRLVHRLDLGTSGVVLLAKGDAAHRVIADAFATRRVIKTYRALVWGTPRPAQGMWEEALGRDREDGRRMEARTDGKPARTRYALLRPAGPLADLRLQPETGRTHQIRVHAAAHGHPIAGDDLYGGGALWTRAEDASARRVLAAVARPLLHAERVEVAEAGLRAAAPLPTDYVRVLEGLADPPKGQ
ncbi:MAG TPA: RNA pseudouridine synthase [Thermoanaerobaculia bacterium]